MATLKSNKKLNTQNPNHLHYKTEELVFEILGDINTETFLSLRVLLIVRYKEITDRENIDLYNSYTKTAFIRKLSEQTKFSIKYIEQAINSLIEELENYKLELIEQSKNKNITTIVLTDQEKQEVITLLKEPELLEKTNELIGKTGLIGNQQNRLLLFLIYLSRKQEIPLHAVVHSPYNYLQTKIGELIPKEEQLTLSHISENALFYFEPMELCNKLILLEDVGIHKNTIRPLLDLQTKQRLTKTTIQKDSHGQLRTIQKEIFGPICLSISTPKEQIFADNAVLSFFLTEDTTTEQQEHLIHHQRQQSAGLINRMEQQQAVKLLQNIQRVLKPIKIVNRYAENILLPKEMLHKQITNLHYLRFIEILTFYKQYQREIKIDTQTGEEYIETTIEDIQQANELLQEILLKQCDGLNKPTRQYFERLKVYLKNRKVNKTENPDNPDNYFTNNQTSLGLNIPLSTVKYYNNTLLVKGFITLSANGNKATGFQYKLAKQNDLQEITKSVKDTLQQTIKDCKKVKRLKGSLP